jgi:hypothetical protein
VALIVRNINVSRVMAVKPEGKGLLERPTLKWEYKIKFRLRIYSGVDWTDLAQVRDKWLGVVKTLTLSLLMSYIYIYGAPSKARNLTSYIYGREFLLGILLLEPCISLIYA